MEFKKKIVFYGVKSFPSRGGTDRVAENLIVQLKDRFDITLYCFKDPLASDYIPGVRVVEFTQLLRGASGSLLYFFISAVYLLFEKNVHAIHAHKTDTAFFFPLLRLRHRIVATSHEAPYKRDKWNWMIKFYFRLAEQMFIKFSNVPTCISQPLTQYYEKRFRRKVIFIPNGINRVKAEDYAPEMAKGFLPSKSLWDEPFMLFSARRLMATKGCHTMLLALQKIKYNGNVFIAGELNPEDPYLKQLKKLSFGLNVHFLGFVHPLPALLALIKRSKLFIFPSETEGMSIMLLEVASVGTPIIASDIPENTQVFGSIEVLYFNSMNVDDLSDKLQFALQHPDEMIKLGINCQFKVNKEYIWKTSALQYAGIYNELR